MVFNVHFGSEADLKFDEFTITGEWCIRPRTPLFPISLIISAYRASGLFAEKLFKDIVHVE
jgi:hypothetical protein